MAGSPRPLHHTPSRSSTPDPIPPPISPGQLASPPGAPFAPLAGGPGTPRSPGGRLPPVPAPPAGHGPRAERWPRQAGGLPSFLPSSLTLRHPPGPSRVRKRSRVRTAGRGTGPPGASRGAAARCQLANIQRAGRRPGKGPPVHHPGNPSDHSANSSAPLPACQLATGPGRAPAGLVMGKRAKRPTAAV